VYSDFYEIPLPALRFEKVEETHKEVNDTEENDARPRQKYKAERKTSRKGRHTTLIDSKTQVNDTQATHASQTTKRRQKRNVNKRFQVTTNLNTKLPMTPARSKQKI
jgi:hypothetical protein